MQWILLVLLLYIIILSHKKEVYEYFHPNENQYTVCSSEDKEQKGETSISIDENKLPQKKKGFYSSILKTTSEKDYPSYFKSPTCISIQKEPLIEFYNKKVIDYNNEDSITLMNPIMDQYQKPTDIYSILYPNIFNETFIQQHENMIKDDDRF